MQLKYVYYIGLGLVKVICVGAECNQDIFVACTYVEFSCVVVVYSIRCSH